MADKKTQLSIVIRTVDQATAGMKAIGAVIARVTKPLRAFWGSLGNLRKASGLDEVIGGFKGVGSAVTDLLGKLLVVGGAIGGLVVGLFHLVDGFDELGDKADEAGVSVEFLAAMRYAAEKSGASIDDLDGGIRSLTTNLGLARAGTGKMAAFLQKVNPQFLAQLKATKSTEEAFDLIARGAEKIVDPAKRAAFAQKLLGDASLAPLLNKGAAGIAKLRAEYAKANPDVGEAAKRAGEVDDAMKELKAATDGVKSSLVVGLAPALKVIVVQLREWLEGHREDIKVWAIELGERIPGAVKKLTGFVRGVVTTLGDFFDSGWKVKGLLVGLAAVILGPVISAVASLGVALLTTPVGWIIAGIAGIAAAAYAIYDNWEAIAGFFGDLWDGVTEIFSTAWKRIKSIVDSVVSAVDTVIGAAGRIADYLGDIGGVGAVRDILVNQQAPGIASQAGDILNAAAAKATGGTDSKLLIHIPNMPRGGRATLDQGSADNIDVITGYQFGTP